MDRGIYMTVFIILKQAIEWQCAILWRCKIFELFIYTTTVITHWLVYI
jgi:hypothetical protein